MTAVSKVGLFIFLLDAYDHYTGGKRGPGVGDGCGESENLIYKKLYSYAYDHYTGDGGRGIRAGCTSGESKNLCTRIF